MGFKNSLTLGNCVKTMHKVIREQIITINWLDKSLKFQFPFEKVTVNMIWDRVFKMGPSKFFKGYLPQNLLSPLLNTLSRMKLTCCFFSIA